MTATTDDSNGNFLPECAGITHTHASTLESRFNVKCSAATRQGQCAQEQLDRDDMHKSNQTGGPIHTRATRQEGRYTQGQPDRRADIHKSNQTGEPADTSATRQELAQRTVADFEMGTCTKDSARIVPESAYIFSRQVLVGVFGMRKMIEAHPK